MKFSQLFAFFKKAQETKLVYAVQKAIREDSFGNLVEPEIIAIFTKEHHAFEYMEKVRVHGFKYKVIDISKEYDFDSDSNFESMCLVLSTAKNTISEYQTKLSILEYEKKQAESNAQEQYNKLIQQNQLLNKLIEKEREERKENYEIYKYYADFYYSSEKVMPESDFKELKERVAMQQEKEYQEYLSNEDIEEEKK